MQTLFVLILVMATSVAPLYWSGVPAEQDPRQQTGAALFNLALSGAQKKARLTGPGQTLFNRVMFTSEGDRSSARDSSRATEPCVGHQPG
jgi:hypothetical protein